MIKRKKITDEVIQNQQEKNCEYDSARWMTFLKQI